MDETLSMYIKWVKANGVDTPYPTVEQASGDAVPGYAPPSYLVWQNGRGSLLKQSIDLMLNGNGGWEPELREVQAFLGMVNPVTVVTWEEFTAPPAPAAPLQDARVGERVYPEHPDAAGKELYQVKDNSMPGARYTQPTTGRAFLCIPLGMFARAWEAKRAV